eukprot:12052112-Ditylum_brightwellii.AAC.1
MPPVLPDTNPDWIAAFLTAEESDKEHLKALIANKKKRRICPLYASQPYLPVLLPKYDHKFLSKIKGNTH